MRQLCRRLDLGGPGLGKVRRAALALALSGVLGMLLAGCTLFQRQSERTTEIRQSWRGGFSVPEDRLKAMPFYSITAQIDPAARSYTGTLDLDFTVSSTSPFRDIFFRTYPNLPLFGGDLEVTGARVNDAAVSFESVASRTAVQLALPKPLKQGSRARVRLSYEGKFGPASQPGEYTIFGVNEDTTVLTNFYPILAGRRGDEWALDVPPPQGDAGFHDAALYRVALTFPSGQIPVATGTEIRRTSEAAGWTTAHYVLGPAREFTALLSPEFQAMEADSLGVRVHSYFTGGNAEAARTALYHAVAALQIYSDQFGPYPYRDLSVVQAPLTFKGMEFPSVVLIGSQAYNVHRQDLENLVVHETAHQWWYNQVGSDQVRSPWLDEGLAEYSMYVYTQQRYGDQAARDLRSLRWEVPVESLKAANRDQPIGRPVGDYATDYEQIVYAKSALFLDKLRQEMGAAKFQELLRAWNRGYQWRIATAEDFRALVNRIAGRNLDALFDEWVGPREVKRP